jgi:amidophosphoribosyltransferase
MCGLVGALAYNELEDKKAEKVRQESMIFFTSELLQLTQTRGKDATGIATLFDDCDYMGLKMGVSAQEFIARFGDSEKDYVGYINIWRKKTKPARAVIGHCRKPSAGVGASSDDNKNNHPIKIGDIIGVHNGTLTNHEIIFNKLGCKRDGLVDSEAIFRLLSHFTNNGAEPFSKEVIQETCKRMSGSYSVLTFNGNNPYQLAAFRDGKPLEIAIIRPLKLVLIASEKDFLKAVIFKYNKMANLYQIGTFKYVPLKKGDVEIETLSDDTLYLFDFRKDITAETKLSDISINEKIPRTNKIWAKETSTTNIYNNHRSLSYWNNNKLDDKTDDKNEDETQKKAEVSTGNTTNRGSTVTKTASRANGGMQQTQTTTSTGSTKQERRVGMAWNRSSNQYESVRSNNDADVHGNVEIDCEDGEIIEAETSEVVIKGKKTQELCVSQEIELIKRNSDTARNEEEIYLTETKLPADNLVTDPAKIEEIIITETNVDPKIEVNRKKTNVLEPRTTNLLNYLKDSTKKISVDVYPDVIEKSVIETRKQENFSNNEDLMNALEISNKEVMNNMELYSLANRIKNIFFKNGWYSGYVERLNEESSINSDSMARNLLVRTRSKMESAQETVRNIKIIARMLSRLIGSEPDDSKVEDVIKSTFNKGEIIDPKVLGKAFKNGDLRDNPAINKLVTLMSNTKDE